jgi:uncharacterized protein YggE
MEGMPFEGTTGEKLRKALLATVVVLGLFLAVEALGGLMGLRYIGSGVQATNTINVSGHGESFSVPDIATFSFSIVSDKTTVAEAQKDATAKINAVTDYLTGAGIDKKDIQTSDYSINPQYTYQQSACPVSNNGMTYPCQTGNQVLKGYEVRQTTTVKVRSTDKAGDMLAGVGAKGATEVSGLNFTFDNPNQGTQEARDKAIADAKTKAEALAKSLGVSLVRVVSFTENGGGNPTPMYYKTSGVAAMDQAAPASPAISVGQNKTTEDVTVTYEIR